VTLHGKTEGVDSSWSTVVSARPAVPKKRWLLIKHRDEFIDPAWDIAKPELDRSAVSSRTLAEIAAGRPAKKRKTSVA
jgi:hypothetical protein